MHDSNVYKEYSCTQILLKILGLGQCGKFREIHSLRTIVLIKIQMKQNMELYMCHLVGLKENFWITTIHVMTRIRIDILNNNVMTVLGEEHNKNYQGGTK